MARLDAGGEAGGGDDDDCRSAFPRAIQAALKRCAVTVAAMA